MNTKLESVRQTRSVHWDISEAVISFHQATDKYMLNKAYVSPGAVGDHGTQPQILKEG